MADPEWKVDEYWKNVSTAVPLVFASLATIAYVLRVYASRIASSTIKVEDYLMGIGLLLSYGATAATVSNAFNGIGVPAKELPHDERLRLNFGSWIIQKFWPTSMGFIKISIIFFLKRLFGARPVVRRWLDGLSIFIGLWAVSALLTNTFQCWPVSYYYDKDQPGHCMPGQKKFFMAMGSLALVEDTIILLIPLPTIWTLQVPLRQKIAITLILSLGSLVCICSLLRIIEFRNFILKDLSSSSALESIFTSLEMNVAVICGCLPLMKPLVRRVLHSTSGDRSYRHSNSSPQDAITTIGSGPSSGRPGQAKKYLGFFSTVTSSMDMRNGRTVDRTASRNSSEVELNGIEVHTRIDQHFRDAPMSGHLRNEVT